MFFFFWIFRFSFWEHEKAVEWRRETRSVLLLAMIRICLQNRAVGYIYHLSAFCESCWWGAEQTFPSEIRSHNVVFPCKSNQLQTISPRWHDDTVLSVNITLFVCPLLTYLLGHCRVCFEALVGVMVQRVS